MSNPNPCPEGNHHVVRWHTQRLPRKVGNRPVAVVFGRCTKCWKILCANYSRKLLPDNRKDEN